MKPVLLIDFGSTYTKAIAVDVEAMALLGTASSPTTAETDIGQGLEEALIHLTGQTGPLAFQERYACSSAAGGLSMVACGLVPSLTGEAAKRAALGAGAKVRRVFSYELTDEDITEIAAIAPDILLLTGGTDGGNKQNILQNAKALSGLHGTFPIVVAGNRAAAKEVEQILAPSGHEVILCENVMPVFNALHIGPVQEAIRDLFLRRIINAKGLSRQQALVDGILMPTPSAVLRGLTLLSEGAAGIPGMGDLMAVDLGGATTDVYSIADGLPGEGATTLRGLPEPRAKRTVEGDIGMRYGAGGILSAVGMDRLCALSGLTGDRVQELLAAIRDNPGILPHGDPDLTQLDHALAASAISLGLVRHAGILEKIYTPAGLVYVQTGKDLTRAEALLLTGGALARTGMGERLAREALLAIDDPASLAPRKARFIVDTTYILAAMGLLCEKHPGAALTILKDALHLS